MLAFAYAVLLSRTFFLICSFIQQIIMEHPTYIKQCSRCRGQTHWQTPMHFQSQFGHHLLQEAFPISWTWVGYPSYGLPEPPPCPHPGIDHIALKLLTLHVSPMIVLLTAASQDHFSLCHSKKYFLYEQIPSSKDRGGDILD